MENTKIIYFDRHASMDSATRFEIMETIRETKSFSPMENYLYGLFDGYNYFLTESFNKEFSEIINTNTALGQRILKIYEKVNTYRQTNKPNNGNH